MFDGMGGVNVSGLEAGLRVLQVPAAARPEIFQKLLLLALLRIQKDADNG